MLRFYNNGSETNNAIQNQFTAYLQKALERNRRDFFRAVSLRSQRELLVEPDQISEHTDQVAFSAQEDELDNHVLRSLPLIDQIENQTLRRILLAAPEQSVQILHLHILQHKTFAQIGEQLGIGNSTVRKYYYVLVRQIRDAMGGAHNG